MDLRVIAAVAEDLVRSQWEVFRAGHGVALARHKQDGSPVTDTDVRIERFLHGHLAEATGIPVVGEESIGCVESRTQEIEELHREVGTRSYWVVDPIDGTSNYLRGDPSCAILAALFVNDTPLIGVTSLPVRSTTITSVAGQSMTVTVGANRVELPAGGWGTPGEGVGLVDSLVPGFRDEVTHMVDALIAAPKPRMRISGCVGANLGLVAVAGVGTTVSMSPHVWDNGAGVCHLTTRGAHVTDLHGNPWTVGSDGVIGGDQKTAGVLSASLQRIGR